MTVDLPTAEESLEVQTKMHLDVDSFYSRLFHRDGRALRRHIDDFVGFAAII
jgi:hypothetical protein